jgi:hypothetical protein
MMNNAPRPKMAAAARRQRNDRWRKVERRFVEKDGRTGSAHAD